MPVIALYEPEIPGNAGSVGRLCAATRSPLHLIGRLGFSFRHPKARRAGMDYWQDVELHRHVAYADFRQSVDGQTVWMLSTHAGRVLWDAELTGQDVFLFGPESSGLPAGLLETDPERCLRIPMAPSARSLNLGTAVAVVLYEALRQDASRGRETGVC